MTDLPVEPDKTPEIPTDNDQETEVEDFGDNMFADSFDDETEGDDESDQPDEQSDESDDDESEGVEPPEEPSVSEEEKRKEAAREAYRAREAARAERAQLEAERQRGIQEQQRQYLEQAQTDEQLALRQLQIDAYNNRVESTSTKLETGIDRAVADIDLFRTGSDEAKEELAQSLDDFERMYVVRDSYGNPVEVRADVYQFLQARADSIRKLIGSGARQQTVAKEQVKSRTDIIPSREQKQTVDTELDAFDNAFK